MTNPLTTTCSLCGVLFSTGTCNHLLDLGDGRVALSREVWVGLVEDRIRLKSIDMAEIGALLKLSQDGSL